MQPQFLCAIPMEVKVEIKAPICSCLVKLSQDIVRTDGTLFRRLESPDCLILVEILVHVLKVNLKMHGPSFGGYKYFSSIFRHCHDLSGLCQSQLWFSAARHYVAVSMGKLIEENRIIIFFKPVLCSFFCFVFCVGFRVPVVQTSLCISNCITMLKLWCFFFSFVMSSGMSVKMTREKRSVRDKRGRVSPLLLILCTRPSPLCSPKWPLSVLVEVKRLC